MAKEPKFKGTIAYSQKPVAGLTIYQEKKEQSLSDMLDELVKDEVTTARKDEILAKIKTRRLQALREAQDAESALREAKSGETVSITKDKEAPKTKRYLVDPESGTISVDEEEGEYTYKDALLVSASIKGKTGHFDDAVSLINAAKALAPEAPSKPNVEATEALKRIFETKKEFYVDDDTGFIIHDPENGEMTLSEARAVSRSMQRAMTPTQEAITPEKLELMKRDIMEEATKNTQIALERKDRGGPAFTVDDDGEIRLDQSARMGPLEILLWSLMKRGERTAYKDKEGNIATLPDHLEIRRFEREEDRKDAQAREIKDLIKEGRKQLAPAIQALRNLRPAPEESKEALKKGGWEKEEEASKTQSSPCAGCGQLVEYTSVPSMVTCDKCHMLNFFGTKEQLAEIKNQLGLASPEISQEILKEEEPSKGSEGNSKPSSRKGSKRSRRPQSKGQ